MDTPTIETDSPARPAHSRLAGIWPGLGVTLLVAACSTLAGRAFPAFGAPLFAIVMGAAVAMARPVPERFRCGLGFCSRRVLQAAVVILGSGLSVSEVVTVGASSLPVLLGTLAGALLLARPVGRALGLAPDLTDLIGVGTAICGASAIAAADSVMDAEDSEVAYAVATIFLFNVLALLSFPAFGHLIGLSQRSFGLWAGTAINDLSSVVAASTMYGHAAAAQAVVVKLTRTLAIVPICVGLSLARARAGRDRQLPAHPPRRRGALTVIRRTVPGFLVGFVAAAGANSAGLIPGPWHAALSHLATWMITTALAAIGLSTKPSAMKAAGWRPLVLGAVLWASVAVTSLLLQGITAWFGI